MLYYIIPVVLMALFVFALWKGRKIDYYKAIDNTFLVTVGTMLTTMRSENSPHEFYSFLVCVVISCFTFAFQKENK